MKPQNKEIIINILKGDTLLNALQPVLNSVITDEITAHPQLSDTMKSFGKELVSIINIPIETVTQIQKGPQSVESIQPSSVVKAGSGACMMFLSMALLRKKHTVIGATIGFAGALLAGGAINEIGNQTNHLKERVLVASTPDEIEHQIDKLISSLEVMDNVGCDEESEKEPVSASFGDNYPNIIKWLQNIYLESESYGEECADTMRRQIERILKTVYCAFVHYDGKNDKLFEFNEDSTITENLELFPAVVANSGKIYPGLVNKPC